VGLVATDLLGAPVQVVAVARYRKRVKVPVYHMALKICVA
jgi:hypothetical protein